ncbi:hypothetical protein K4G22_09920 [Streptomyces profundus]|nr:hypothetical protein K4G22_09920 [Streptomyces sp. MA3_2.13]
MPGVGEVLLVTVTSHQPWGITARVRGYEHLGASLDVIRRGHEPGVRRLARALPAVGSTLELTVGRVHHRDRAPRVWLDLTAP